MLSQEMRRTGEGWRGRRGVIDERIFSSDFLLSRRVLLRMAAGLQEQSTECWGSRIEDGQLCRVERCHGRHRPAMAAVLRTGQPERALPRNRMVRQARLVDPCFGLAGRSKGWLGSWVMSDPA